MVKNLQLTSITQFMTSHEKVNRKLGVFDDGATAPNKLWSKKLISDLIDNWSKLEIV